MAGGVPRLFGNEQSGESIRNLGLWFEWNLDDQLVAGLFGFCGLELVNVVAVRRKEGERANFRCVRDGKFQQSAPELCFHGDRGDLDWHFAAGPVKEALQIDIVLGLGGEGEIEVGLTGQAGFLANKPFDLCFDRKRGWSFFVIRNREGCKKECFLFVSIANEGGDKDFFRKWELQRASDPSGWKFPIYGRGKTRVPRVFPINMPTWDGTKTKPQSQSFSSFHGFWLGQKIHRDLWGLSDRTSPEGSLEKRETSKDPEDAGSLAVHGDRIS